VSTGGVRSRPGHRRHRPDDQGEQRRLAASKLSPPPRRPGIVDRPTLTTRLSSLAAVPVVLVSAPAGYGKTTLLALWATIDERAFAWVTLDGSDNDPVVFVTTLLTALQPHVDVSPQDVHRLRSSNPARDEVDLPPLTDAGADAAQPFVLVLDDLHLVTEARCHDVIARLVDRLPPGSQIALSTRTDPPLPLGSWRAHGHLLELRADDLALDAGEAAALLAASHVERLDDDQVVRLVDRTEGWSAAIYLAALSLRGRAEPAAFVDDFTGTNRYVTDFLSEDVMARLPEDVIEFLLHTCVLDELTPSLCDAVAAVTDSGERLRWLEGSNLFVVPLDEHRHTYRYHHLFGQYLLAELVRREPGIVAELHRRAYQWYREHRLTGRAVHHAQASGDADAAAELIATRWMPTMERGQVETVRHWLSWYTDRQLEQNAPLAVAAAWIFGYMGERDRALRFADAAKHGAWQGPMPDGAASLESAVSTLSAVLAIGGITGMAADAQRTVGLEPIDSPWRTGALTLLGQAQAINGDFERATATLQAAETLTAGNHASSATTLAYLAFIDLRTGQLERATERAERAHAIAEQPTMATFLPNIATYSVVAAVHTSRGDLDAAAHAVARAEALLPRLTDAFWWQLCLTHILLAPALHALGRNDEATRLLNVSAHVLEGHSDAGQLPQWQTEATRLVTKPKPRAQSMSLTTAEQRVLRLLDSDLTLREIGRELYLSLNTVRTHTHSIYRKLGVSSRAEAVQTDRVHRARTRVTSTS
jgi:LuxR family maltose regulon positive regulatory protein